MGKSTTAKSEIRGREYRGPATRSPTVGARVIDADARFVRQVRAPAGRLRLPRQIGDELLPGVEQFPLVDDVVAVEDGAALVAETASVRRQAPRNVASILDQRENWEFETHRCACSVCREASRHCCAVSVPGVEEMWSLGSSHSGLVVSVCVPQ